MVPAHEPWLVALSLLVAFQGSYVGLHLARQIRGARNGTQRALITGSALTLALGIWTMHFVGMLAVQLPVAIDFLVLPTLLSFLICVLVVGFAVFAVGTGAPNRLRAGLAAIFMGGGIFSMHYLGMYALHASTHMTHDPFYVIASIVIGVGASGIALWFGFGLGVNRSILIPSCIMALAISAMHYTAMAGMELHLHGGVVDMPALSPGLLAIVVSVVAFVVSGLFLLTLVPVQNRIEAETAVEAPPMAQLLTVPAPIPAKDHGSGHVASQHATQRSLPVEKDGRRLQLDIARLVAVQAQAHYTSLFDGETIWFCPLPISEVEAALDPMVFARVHRSHIVNLDRVASVRRAADSDVVAMAAKIPYQAPVSRSRRSWLKQQLDARASAA
ncbi:MAG: LytTR family transcriptional regulator DNA-binding domain-containing protein [Rhodospirillaceae bacterium]|nr:LytTR family transcriptional regulator DNA-binding domain-containing protein [Rhodospirillaceae bacterium]